MSDKNDEKNETEVKLMNDTEKDKSYGTEGTVILPTGEQSTTHVGDEEAGEQGAKIKRNKSSLKKIRSFEPKGSHLSFLNRMVSLVFDTIFGIIALLVANVVQVACIVIGSVYIKDCPIEPGIPIVLIVNGAINVLVCILEGIKRRINKNSDVMKKFNLLMNLIKITSLVAFGAWIYIIYDSNYPSFDDSTNYQNYCNKTLFLFAFWLLNVYLILMLIMVLFVCCCCCFATAAVIDDKASP